MKSYFPERRFFFKNAAILVAGAIVPKCRLIQYGVGEYVPRQISASEVRGAILSYFMRQGSPPIDAKLFRWEGSFGDVHNMDSLDLVELVIHTENELKYICPDILYDKEMNNKKTPDSLAAFLLDGLNHALVTFSQPGFLGEETRIFTKKGIGMAQAVNKSNGSHSFSVIGIPGSVHKPSIYSFSVILGTHENAPKITLGNAGHAWECPDFLKKLSQLFKINQDEVLASPIVFELEMV